MQKQVDDIQIEVDGSENVLFGGQAAHDQVGIVNNEERENHRTLIFTINILKKYKKILKKIFKKIFKKNILKKYFKKIF